MSLAREVTITPAWDRRDPDPSKNYGIHGCDLRMVVIGPEGAVQFVVFTNWHLPHVMAETHAKVRAGDVGPYCLETGYEPMGADVGYHSKVPMYDGQDVAQDDCEYTGGACYYDGSGLRAEEWLTVLIEQGSDAIWTRLENEYRDRFDAYSTQTEDT